MVETAPGPETHKAANPKPTRACSETQAPSPNHFLKNSRRFFSAFQFLLPASHVLWSMAKALLVRNRFGCQSIAPGWFDSHSGTLVTRENRDMSNPSGTACQPCVSSLFDRTKMPILTISSALPLRPFCNLAVDWTDVRNDWPTRPGKENEKHRRKQKHN